MTIFNNKKSGFTLVEVLVSITILLMVIVGPMSIISRSINSTNFSSQQVNAWFLAQEGLELAQKVRDDLVLAGIKDSSTKPFDTFQKRYTSCFSSTGCDLTITNPGTVLETNCSASNNPCLLALDITTTKIRSRYVHEPNKPPSPFTRVITMSPVNSALGKVREIKVTSTVTWRTGSLIAGQKVLVSTYLFNIYDTD